MTGFLLSYEDKCFAFLKICPHKITQYALFCSVSTACILCMWMRVFHKFESRNMFDPHRCPCSFHLFITPGQKLEFFDNHRGSRKISYFPLDHNFFHQCTLPFRRKILSVNFQQLLCVFFLRCYGSVELLDKCDGPFSRVVHNSQNVILSLACIEV